MEKNIMSETIIRPQEAVEYLRDVGIRLSTEKLCLGIQQKVFPFGDFVSSNGHGRDVYIIYTKTLCAWAAARSTIAEQASRKAQTDLKRTQPKDDGACF